MKTGNGAAPSFALNTPRGTLVFRAGSQVATWDELQVHLGFAPQLIDGQPYLHNLDVSKTLFALAFSQEDIPVGRGLVVVIDPGHGGADAGTGGVSGRRNEKDLTLDLAKRLQSLLIANGWQVWLTRSNDTATRKAAAPRFDPPAGMPRRACLGWRIRRQGASPNRGSGARIGGRSHRKTGRRHRTSARRGRPSGRQPSRIRVKNQK